MPYLAVNGHAKQITYKHVNKNMQDSDMILQILQETAWNCQYNIPQ